MNADELSPAPSFIEEPKETLLIKQAAKLIADPEASVNEEPAAAQVEIPPAEKPFLPQSPKGSSAPAWLRDRSWTARYLPPAIQRFTPSDQPTIAKISPRKEWVRKHLWETSLVQEWLIPFFRADWLPDIQLSALDKKNWNRKTASLSAEGAADADKLVAIREESSHLLSLLDPLSLIGKFVKGNWLPQEIRERAESPAAIENARDKFRRFALAFIKGDWIEFPATEIRIDYRSTAQVIEQEPFLYLKDLTLQFIKGSWIPKEAREMAETPELQEGFRNTLRRYSLAFARGDWIDSLLPYLAVNFTIQLSQPQPVLASSEPLAAASEEEHPLIPSLAPSGKPVRLYLPNAQVKKFAIRLFEQKKDAYLLAKQSQPKPKPEEPSIAAALPPEPAIKETPVAQTEKPETPAPETPIAQTPKLEPPIAQAQTPKPETPVAQAQTPRPEAPVAQAQTLKPETPVAQAQTPKPETPVAQAQTPKPETPIAQAQTPKPETPIAQAEAPKPETPIAQAEAPVVEIVTPSPTKRKRKAFIPPTMSESTPHVTASLFDLFSKKPQPAPPPPPAPKRNPWPLPKRLELRHIVGFHDCADCAFTYGTNYTAAALMIAPEYKPGHFLPILDLRGARFDNVSYASSLGMIARYIPDSEAFCQMLGANIYWDYRQGSVGYFNQIGLGIEILSRRWDIRANGYVPVGPRHKIHKCIFDDYIGPFFVIDEQNEFVSFGFNAEVGHYLIRGKDFLLYAAAGPYFVAGREFHQNTFGGMVRVKPMYRDFAAVDVIFSHDPLFNNIWQVNFIVNIPLYELSKTNNPPCGLKNQQIYQPVQRFEVMPLSRCDCWFKNY